MYLACTACAYSDYPLEATFCDDWCRVLRRTGCEQEPENCIRDCESALPGPACLGRQEELLVCYESTPADRFECAGQGFQSTVRPRPEICTEQRHSLIRCEAPRVMECVEACAALEPAQMSVATSGAVDGDVRAACPVPPFPCERLCWELDARFGRGEPSFTGPGLDTMSDADLAALGAPLIQCAHERAAECASAAPTGGGPVSWTSLFLECAGLGSELDALD